MRREMHGERPRAVAPAKRRLLPLAVGVVFAAWLPAVTASLLVWSATEGWSSVLRLVVTALVYAPAAGILIARRSWAVASIIGSLAVSSGMLALIVAVDVVRGHEPAFAGVVSAAAVVARQPEIAALSILLWLFVRHPLRWIGISAGLAAIVIDLLLWALRLVGVSTPSTFMVIPLALALVSFPIAGTVLAVQWGHGTRAQRETLGWFLLGAGLLVLSYVRLLGGLPPLALAFADAAFVLAQGFLPTAILAAALSGGTLFIIWPRLSEGVAWTQALATAISFYIVLDALALQVGIPRGFAGAIAAGALAISFTTMLRAVRRRTARVFLGPGIDGRAVFNALSERIDVSEPESVLDELARSLRDTWQLCSVTLAPSAEPIVTVGEEGRFIATQTVTSAGDSVCTITLTANDPALLQRVALPMLAEVGPLLAVAVQLATANQEVAAARSRMWEVRREERRILHRELRDELAPSLAGVGFAMAALHRQLTSGTPVAPAAVRTVREDLAVRTDGVRRLARALLPSALDAGDLEGALRELGERIGGAETAVKVAAPGADALEVHTQVAVYLVVADVLDALRGRPLSIVIRTEQRRVLLSVRENTGSREPLSTSAFESIRRRCADAGGTIEVVSAEGACGLDGVIPR